MTTNLRDVAEVAGVSLSTASRVFTNAANVSEDIRVRVIEASTKLGYRHRERIRRVQVALRKVVLFVRSHNRTRLSSMLGDFYGYVLQGIEAECRRHRLSLIFAHDGGNDELSSQLDELALDEETGVLMVGPFTADDVHSVQQRNLPVVLINHTLPNAMVDAVLPDYYGGAQLAVQHLIDCGHQRIAYIHGPDRHTTNLRLQGYLDTLKAAHLPIDPSLIVQSTMSAQSAGDAVRELIERNVEFSALFCINDITAYGASMALLEARLRPGRDVALIGFDDLDLSQLTRMRLTTIHVPKIEMGHIAVRRLLERSADPDGAPQRITIAVNLVERDTVHRLESLVLR
jgi:LacI family transcriptional regulator